MLVCIHHGREPCPRQGQEDAPGSRKYTRGRALEFTDSQKLKGPFLAPHFTGRKLREEWDFPRVDDTADVMCV